MTVKERLVASVTDIRTRGRRLADLHRELTAAEMKDKGKRFGGAIGLFAGAGVLGVFAVGFVLATITVLLDLVLPLWAAMLIVTGVLFLVIAILVLVGRSLVQKAQKPAPEAAIAEGKKTAELLKENVRMTADGVRAKVKTRRAGPGDPAAPVAPPPAAPAADPKLDTTSDAEGQGA